MGQLLQLIPRHIFHYLVDTHAWQGPNPRKLPYWLHLGAKLLGQLPPGACRGKALHPGRRLFGPYDQ